MSPLREAKNSFSFSGGALPPIQFGNSHPPNCYADAVNRVVYADHAALLSLWATAKAILALTQAAAIAMRAAPAGATSAALDPAASAIAEARTLVKAAKTARLNSLVKWPVGLPAPDSTAQPPLQAGYDNALFLQAIAWVLLHELAHIHLGHQGAVPDAISIRQEQEADDWATRWLFDKVPDAAQRSCRIYATATALCWLGILRQPKSTTHPHPSERFLACSQHFGASSTDPAAELASYAIKVLFDPATALPTFADPSAALDALSLHWLRLPR